MGCPKNFFSNHKEVQGADKWRDGFGIAIDNASDITKKERFFVETTREKKRRGNWKLVFWGVRNTQHTTKAISVELVPRHTHTQESETTIKR
jgi:hypothetical protein